MHTVYPMLKRGLFIAALLASSALPLRADDVSNRVDRLEGEIRQLTGQVEQLTYQLKQVQAQRKLGAADVAPASTELAGAAPAKGLPDQQAAVPTQPAVIHKKPTLVLSVANAGGSNAGDGVETIGDARPAATPGQIAGGIIDDKTAQNNAALAPPPTLRPQGLGVVKSAQSGDGGFQGKVLVAPGGQPVASQPVAPVSADQMVVNANDNSSQGLVAQPASVQTTLPETPDDLFQRHYQALLQLRYADAEVGFKDFVAKYPDHGLAGSAEFWLGEAYWADGDIPSAAKAYLDSYKKYPKSRRAPDSLLKLGMSLLKLGQKDQACATIGSVDTEYPNAVDVKKRAQAAFKHEGCA